MGEPLRVKHASELARFRDQPLGPTGWRQVGQDAINAFAALTDDSQWIHVDSARAAQALPNGRTIVPGHLLLALFPSLIRETYLVSDAQSSRLAVLRNVRFRQAIERDVPFRFSGRILNVTTRGLTTFVEIGCELTLFDQALAVEANRVDAFQN